MNISVCYVQIQPSLAFSADLHGKWYGVHKIPHTGEFYSRYIHPDGWKKIAHYWNTKEEAEKAVEKSNYMPGVTQQEVTDLAMMKEDCDEFSFDRY